MPDYINSAPFYRKNMRKVIEDFFNLKALNSDIRIEIIADVAALFILRFVYLKAI
jgi:xanthine/uracil/vitamin C permease (AzgA family)